MTKFELGEIEVSGATGLDALLQRESHILRPHALAARHKVASLGDLKSFIRLSAETLVHKSERELWALRKEADGQYFVERLFDENGEPLKG